MRNRIMTTILLTLFVFVAGCVSMKDGVVGILDKGQYKVHTDMSSAQVRAALGDPSKIKGPYNQVKTEELFAHLFPDTPIMLNNERYTMWYYEADVTTYYFAVVQYGKNTEFKQCYFVFDATDKLKKSSCTNPAM